MFPAVFMDNPNIPKARPPLPTPGLLASQRPNTPVLGATFYSSQNDMAPDLLPSTGDHWIDDTNQAANVWPAHENWQESASDWEANWTGGDKNNGAAPGLESMDYVTSNRMDHDFIIDGRSTYEETHWWNPELRKKNKRPGPGVLPPVLAEELHDSKHSLFSLNVTIPSTPSPSDLRSSVEYSPPTEKEVRASIPHPNAHYCPKDNGWVILSWKSSSVAPPLARSYIASGNPPLPDQIRRRRAASCIEESDQPFGKTNETHHFHKYEKAVDSHKFWTPPYRKEGWESLETIKGKRPVGTILTTDSNTSTIKAEDVEMLGNIVESAEEEGVIPGVIPPKHLKELVKDKKKQPAVDKKSAEQSIEHALHTLLIAIENKLWKCNNRAIKVFSAGFQTKVGWNLNTKRIFELLGFVEEITERGPILKPPVTDLTLPQGKQNRRKLLRAWLEIGSWLTNFKRIYAIHFEKAVEDSRGTRTYVQLNSAREIYQTAIGAHPDQISRGGLSDSMLDIFFPLEVAWQGLGLTPTTYSADLLEFSYLAQCRCDPAGTPQYFTYLTTIVKQLQEFGSCPPQLQELLAMERSRGRFTSADIETAATTLGFGIGNVLDVVYGENVGDQFVEKAWKESAKRSWRDLEHGSDTYRLVNEEFRILAESRGSIKLRKIFENGKHKYMTPDQAYDTLEVPNEVDDFMLIMVYNIRLDEAPSQLDKIRDAMMVIAETRDSERLRQFIASRAHPCIPQPPCSCDDGIT